MNGKSKYIFAKREEVSQAESISWKEIYRSSPGSCCAEVAVGADVSERQSQNKCPLCAEIRVVPRKVFVPVVFTAGMFLNL